MNFDFLTDKVFFPAITHERLSRSSCVNFVYSPLFIQFFNVLLRFGSDGETAEEIKSQLKHMNSDRDTMMTNIRNQIASIVGQGDNPSVRFINRMFIRKCYRIREEFKSMAAEFFRVNIVNVDYNNYETAVMNINDQVLADTRGQTKKLMKDPEISSGTKLVLTSGTMFKIRWRQPFPTDQIFQKNFHVNEDLVFKINFLHAVNHYNCYESKQLGIDMVELTLENGGSMVVVRPKELDGLRKIEEKIVEIFSIPLTDFHEDFVRVEIPKFKIITRTNYKNIMINCGVTKIFNPNEASLSGIVENPDGLYVDWFFQKMSFQVEDGGISSGELFSSVPGGPEDDFFSHNAPNSFVVDRPFIFYVKYWDHILFGGQVENPNHYVREVPETSRSDGSGHSGQFRRTVFY